jgi:hypothetical protein
VSVGRFEESGRARLLRFITGLRACLERKDWTVADYEAALGAQAELGLSDADLPDSVLAIVQDVRDMLAAIKRDMTRIDLRFGWIDSARSDLNK